MKQLPFPITALSDCALPSTWQKVQREFLLIACFVCRVEYSCCRATYVVSVYSEIMQNYQRNSLNLELRNVANIT